nr:hypothetical protein [Tanacetum cinerariifolium]
MDASFNNENEAWEYSLDIDDSDLHLTPIVRSSNSTHGKPSPYTTNPVTIILGPSGVVHVSSGTRVEPSTSNLNPVRIIPGTAVLVQQARLLKEKVFILDPYGALMSTQQYMDKFVEDVGDDDDFKSAAWVSATNYVNTFGGIDTLIGKIVNPTFPSILLNIIQEVVVMKTKGIDVVSFIKPKCGDGTNISLWNDAWRGGVAFKILAPRIYMLESMKDIRSLEGSREFSVSSIRKTIDAAFLPCGNVKTRWVKEVPIKINILPWKVSNDYLPTRFNLSRKGTIPGTIHHNVIGKGGYGKDITVGAAMILKNVSVFSPNPSKHYLNITMRNVVEVFRKDIVLGNGSG